MPFFEPLLKYQKNRYNQNLQRQHFLYYIPNVRTLLTFCDKKKKNSQIYC